MGRRMVGKFAVLLFLAALWPTPVQAEDPHGIGIVTTLTGQATITRAALPLQSSPLKFRDELFYRDHISTKEHSMARVLLGGKALITVRELSELTITEEPGRQSIVDLAIGKLSMAVVHSRMSPGETIEVRTPNAVAGVRGTVLVVEVTPALATEIYVLKGSVEVFPKGLPAAAIIVNAFQSVTITGNLVGRIRSIPALAVDQIVRDLKPTYQHTETPDETKKAVQEIEQARALTHAKAVTEGTQEPEVPKEAVKAKESKRTEVAQKLSGSESQGTTFTFNTAQSDQQQVTAGQSGNVPPGNAYGLNRTQSDQQQATAGQAGNTRHGNARGLNGTQPGQQAIAGQSGNVPTGNAFGLTGLKPGKK